MSLIRHNTQSTRDVIDIHEIRHGPYIHVVYIHTQFERVTYKKRISVTSLLLGGVGEGQTNWDVPCTNTHRHRTNICNNETQRTLHTRHMTTYVQHIRQQITYITVHSVQDNYTYNTWRQDGEHATSDLKCEMSVVIASFR